MMGEDRTTKNQNGSALGSAEFEALMTAVGLAPLLLAGTVLAVGVSGGPDSMALGLSTQRWAQAQGGDAVALIVDHGLRAESTAEAEQVAEWLRAQGMAAHILTWRGSKPTTGVQAAAREARYQLLVDRCDAEGIRHLLLGHHRNDQAETFLLRLSRGSGIDGLACMAPRAHPPLSKVTDVRILRPLLAVPKSRLIATLEAWGVAWVEDPSNSSLDFTRVRMRQALEGLESEGLTSERLSLTAKRMARARDALNAATNDLIDRAVRQDPTGYCEIALSDFCQAPDEISLRALGVMLRWAGGANGVLRLERAERLHTAIIDPGTEGFPGKTLGGCRVQVVGRSTGPALMICREPAAVDHRLSLRPGAKGKWDGRFRVSLRGRADSNALGGQAAPLPEVRCLGESGWREISGAVSDARHREVPAPVRPSLPALWDHNGVAAVPLVGFERPGLAAEFGGFSTQIQGFDRA
jgi:tRNA(Ile)-lysidine synthase